MKFLFWLCVFVSIWYGTIILAKAAVKDSTQWYTLLIFAAALTPVVAHLAGAW